MIVSINQPAYLPWLGYFQRIAVSDKHIVLDHVQFEKNSFTNRNKVKTRESWCWLTVPVKTSGHFGNLPINAVRIDNDTDWRTKHWRTLLQNYAKTPHFAEHAPFFERVYRQEWTHLAPLCREITNYLLQLFGITTTMLLSSEMSPTETKSALVLELCQEAGAKTYLSGNFGKQYLDEMAFARTGIRVVYQDYQHPKYSQSPCVRFEPSLAAIDLLFNYGSRSRDVLLGGQTAEGLRADGIQLTPVHE